MPLVSIKQGDVLRLELLLDDRAMDKYPQARVFDSSYSEITSSPFPLSHVAYGVYKNDSFTVPTTSQYLTVVYEVYLDPSRTIFDQTYTVENDRFFVTRPGVRHFIEVPPVLELPLSSTKDYRFYIHIFDEAGRPQDPSSNLVEIALGLSTQDPNTLSKIVLSRESIGVYYYDYTVSSTQTPARQKAVFYFTIGQDQLIESQIFETSNISSIVSSNNQDINNLVTQSQSNQIILDSLVNQTSINTTTLLELESEVQNLSSVISNSPIVDSASQLRLQTVLIDNTHTLHTTLSVNTTSYHLQVASLLDGIFARIDSHPELSGVLVDVPDTTLNAIIEDSL